MASLLPAVRLAHGDDAMDATAQGIDANVKATSDMPVGEPALFTIIMAVVRSIGDGGSKDIEADGQR
jgi:hypothetical protein